MLQLSLLFFADFIVDEVHLEMPVDGKQHDEEDCEEQECPPRESVGFEDVFSDEFEHFLTDVVGQHEEGQYQRTIEGGRQQPPPHTLVDKRAYQQVPLAVNDHHQVEQHQHTQRCPVGKSTTPDNENVGHKGRHPNKVAEVEYLLDEETVDGGKLADGGQQVGFDQHHRCLLGQEAHAEVKNQDERHGVEHQLGFILLGGYPSEERAKGNEFNDKNTYANIPEELAILVGLEHRVALLTELRILP